MEDQLQKKYSYIEFVSSYCLKGVEGPFGSYPCRKNDASLLFPPNAFRCSFVLSVLFIEDSFDRVQ